MRKTVRRRAAKKRRRIGRSVLLLVLMALAVLLADSNMRLTVNEYALSYAALPTAFDGYRIAQLSDVHAAVFGKDNAALLGAVKNARPDIIVITGDLINYDDDAAYSLGIVRPLVRRLTDIAPVYYVTGNHEWDTDWLRELFKALDDEGVRVLRNEYALLTRGGASIVLAGLEDPNGPRDMKKPEEVVSKIRSAEGETFIVVLEHRNSYLKRLSGLGVDLILCGHSHGGIIRLPFAGGLIGPSLDLFPTYSGGLYSENGTKMLVSRGVGNNTGVPRFLNNPEIPVVILKKS
jgi:predicted MPP superfamily phosphohydrolase